MSNLENLKKKQDLLEEEQKALKTIDSEIKKVSKQKRELQSMSDANKTEKELCNQASRRILSDKRKTIDRHSELNEEKRKRKVRIKELQQEIKSLKNNR